MKHIGESWRRCSYCPDPEFSSYKEWIEHWNSCPVRISEGYIQRKTRMPKSPETTNEFKFVIEGGVTPSNLTDLIERAEEIADLIREIGGVDKFEIIIPKTHKIDLLK